MIAFCAYGFWRLGQGNYEQRYVVLLHTFLLLRKKPSSELKREKAWSRIHLVPLLLAESDRDTYRREQAMLAREKEIMKDVPNWKVSLATSVVGVPHSFPTARAECVQHTALHAAEFCCPMIFLCAELYPDVDTRPRVPEYAKLLARTVDRQSADAISFFQTQTRIVSKDSCHYHHDVG